MGLLDSKMGVEFVGAKLKKTVLKDGSVKRLIFIELSSRVLEDDLEGLPESFAAQFAVMTNGEVDSSKMACHLKGHQVSVYDLREHTTPSLLFTADIHKFEMQRIGDADAYQIWLHWTVEATINEDIGIWAVQRFGNTIWWNAINRQRGLNLSNIVDRLVPEGCDSVTISSPGHEPVTLNRKDGKVKVH